MKTVSKAELKARMLEYFREVERTGEPLRVTDQGREVLEVRPVGRAESASETLASVRETLFGRAGTREISEGELMAREWPEPEVCDEPWLEDDSKGDE